MKCQLDYLLSKQDAVKALLVALWHSIGLSTGFPWSFCRIGILDTPLHHYYILEGQNPEEMINDICYSMGVKMGVIPPLTHLKTLDTLPQRKGQEIVQRSETHHCPDCLTISA